MASQINDSWLLFNYPSKGEPTPFQDYTFLLYFILKCSCLLQSLVQNLNSKSSQLWRAYLLVYIFIPLLFL